MSDWNLPPGVSTNDLPGNRPEDIAWERWFEGLLAAVDRKAGKGSGFVDMIQDVADGLEGEPDRRDIYLDKCAAAVGYPTFESYKEGRG